MDVYIVITQGVYRHGIVGVFASEPEACAAAGKAAARDDYHEFPVIRMTLGAPGERLICSYQRRDARHLERGRFVIDSTDINRVENKD